MLTPCPVHELKERSTQCRNRCHSHSVGTVEVGSQGNCIVGAEINKAPTGFNTLHLGLSYLCLRGEILAYKAFVFRTKRPAGWLDREGRVLNIFQCFLPRVLMMDSTLHPCIRSKAQTNCSKSRHLCLMSRNFRVLLPS